MSTNWLSSSQILSSSPPLKKARQRPMDWMILGRKVQNFTVVKICWKYFFSFGKYPLFLNNFRQADLCCNHLHPNRLFIIPRGGRNVKFHFYDRPFFSLHQKCPFSSSLLRNHYIKNVFLVDHYIKIDKDHYYKSSWSLLRKSERQKEWKEHQKSQFCLIFTFWLPMA